MIYRGKGRFNYRFSWFRKNDFHKEICMSWLMRFRGRILELLENDFGAVNVDMMLLHDLEGENCELEMVSGGCDADCHRRRFKDQLIAMGMCGYDRVLIEPSGILMWMSFRCPL